MEREFIERRDDSFYLVGSRVPLASIVREFQDGQSPEAIRSAFPTLTLEQCTAPLPSTWDTGRKWTRIWRRVSATKAHSPIPIPLLLI